MKLSRRNVLVAGGLVGGGLLLGFNLSRDKKVPYPNAIAGAWQPNAFIQITPDSKVVLQIHKTEMGQGILTGLATLVAEELNVSPWQIETPFSGVHPDYLNPQFDLQITNASSSMITCYTPVREAAAAVGALLLQAAADDWGTGVETLQLQDRRVVERGGSRQATFGELVERAAGLPVPEQVELKPRSEFKYIGKFDQRLDSAGKTNGSTAFGIDTELPEALTAVVVRCPHFGGRLKKFDASEASKTSGVLDIFEIDPGIAVVATNYWHARRAADQIQVEWHANEAMQESSASIDAEQSRLLDERASEDSDLPDGVISAEYTAPFQAHACMEPMNATVDVRDDHVEVWVSTQSADIDQSGVAHALGRPFEDVTVHSTFSGGGFGRRVYPFASVEAALISRKMKRPVKVIWSREDDIRHDLYRPAVKARMSAELGDDAVKQWRYRICTPSLHATLIPGIKSRLFPSWLPDFALGQIVKMAAKDDIENIEGAMDTAYQLGEMDADQVMWKPGIPVSFWRSVGHSFNGFFVEGFIDEMANKAGADPIEFRRAHLEPGSRTRIALDRVVEESNWGKTEPGVFQGIAVDRIKGAICAQVADVKVDGDQIRVKRITCVVDPGLIINPDIAKTQIESCIVWGLTAALKGEITIAERAVQQSNFHDFPLLRMNETPKMEIHLIESGDHPSGVGECAVAPVAPAVANAVFKATGQRLRSLPLRL